MEGEWIAQHEEYGPTYNGDNGNCNDTKKLFEYVVARPSDLLNLIYIYYYSRENKTKVDLENKDVIIKLDHADYGRCFTMRPTLEMIRKGIKRILMFPALKGGYTPTIFFHTPGTFTWQSYRGTQATIQPQPQKSSQFNLDYEMHNDIENIGLCSNDKIDSSDTCIQNNIKNASLARYGCTTPFELDKSAICINKTIAKGVLEMYKDMWEYPKGFSHSCLRSCRTFIVRPLFIREFRYISKYSRVRVKVELNFSDIVSKTQEVFGYELLSLVAEIGGYVGLFLGVSVNQLSMFAEFLVYKFGKTS